MSDESAMKMKVAFVVQRYGTEVNGGSEFLCRQLAQKMSRHWDLEVLTTCAMDYMTWQDEYAPGLQTVEGVLVRRFRVDYPRCVLFFNKISEGAYSAQTTPEVQRQWAQEQGPYSSDFLRYIVEHQNEYQLFFFFTYLYGLTVFGLPQVSHKSILIPTAHDEPSFHLEMFRPLFTQARALLFQTPEERDLVINRFQLKTPHSITSVGIDIPVINERDQLQFNQIFHEKIGAPYLLYLGRIDESKGCAQLFEFFLRFLERNPGRSLKLVLAGKSVMNVPIHPSICSLGFLDESLKAPLLSQSIGLVMPSPYESLSLVTLEAWSLGIPALVNAQSTALKGQAERSGAGLSYSDFDGFEKGLLRLLDEPLYAKELGKCGEEFVKKNYLWAHVEKAYLDWARSVLTAPILDRRIDAVANR